MKIRLTWVVYIITLIGVINISSKIQVKDHGLNATSVGKIIKKHVKAIGGIKRINSQQNLHAVGVMESDFMGKVKIEMWMLHNRGFRSDMTKNDTTRSSIIYDHYRWNESNPGKKSKAQKMPDAMWESMDLDLAGEIVDYEKKGNAAEYIGIESIDGNKCFKLKITRKNGKTTYYFIDTKTYMILQSTVFVLQDGKEVEQGTSRFSDYRKTNVGTMQPYLLVQINNGKVASTTRISLLEINKLIDEQIFKIPEN